MHELSYIHLILPCMHFHYMYDEYLYNIYSKTVCFNYTAFKYSRYRFKLVVILIPTKHHTIITGQRNCRVC